MPKGTNQKLKLYRLAQIMLENTDDEHYITMPEIMEELGKYEVTADRKTIYADLRDLSVLGIEVEGEPIGNRYHYRVVNRPFELPELKLLVDSIQSSKFITEKKTNTLIKKLEKLVSKYDAQRLQRQVYVSGRIKTMNESIYYTVDAIHNAISENKKIKFQYFQWNVKKEMELRHGGAWYHISPWGLSWDDENYYMIGYDTEAQLIKHYRVDKMLHIRMSDESREGKEHFKKLDMADYAKKSFGMFRGKETSVKMLVNNSLAGVIIDRFGKDVMMIPEDADHFRVNVDVHVSKQFLGWVFSLGEAVKIIGPDEVVEQMKGEARRLMEQYGEQENKTKPRIESEIEVKAYIQNLKFALNNGAKIDFQVRRLVDEKRDEKYSNQYTVNKLFPDENPEEALKRELLTLTVEDYMQTVKDYRFPKRSEMREFGKVYNGTEDVYIKIRVEVLGAYVSTTTFVMSFHFAEKAFTAEMFPYKKQQEVFSWT